MLTNNIALGTKYESWLQNCNFLISIVPLDDTCAWMIGRTALGLQIRTLKELKKKATPNMIFLKVLILTLFILGTFAKCSIENMEERFEVMERKLAALTKAFEVEDNDLMNMEGIETNRNLLTSFVSGVADFFLFLFPKK